MLIDYIAQQSHRRTTQLHRQVHDLQHALTKVMRDFGRRCRGQGRVVVTLVRQTEQQLLALGEPIKTFGLKAKEHLEQTHTLREAPRVRLTLAPMVKGQTHCPAQFGRQPGLASEPATGFIFATLVPPGNASDAHYVVPLLAKVQRAMERGQTGPQRQRHSVAGDLWLHDAVVRQALHTRGILTVGIPKTIEPIKTNPSAQDVFDILTEAGLPRKRTPYQVHLACASGYSRPVVESHSASLLSRGVGHVQYKGLEGAVFQQGITRGSGGPQVVRSRVRSRPPGGDHRGISRGMVQDAGVTTKCAGMCQFQGFPEPKNRQCPIVARDVTWIMFPYTARLRSYDL